MPVTTRLRVGVSALFDPDATPHARTFMRALAVARNFIPNLAQVQWHFLDDGADAVRGADVAQRMIDWQADLVIGHFSSDAAVSAAPRYEQAGIALLTPAATIDRLTQEHRNVFRFCPSDRQLAADLVRWLVARQWASVQVDADGSAHGQALAVAIGEALGAAGLRRVSDRDSADVEVFAGRLKASREHWQARRQAGSVRPLVLTDDAASPHLGCAPAHDRNTFVIGFGTPDSHRCPASAWHRALFAAEPHTYFRESLLMLHVLAVLAGSTERGQALLNALHHNTLSAPLFSTPMGTVSFDQGECRTASTCLWKLGPAGLGAATD
ncbi:ABC transporter [Pseudomonas syringae CC1557]|uniref:ABC transporter n=1 Tax=Pseudomonas syringae CC1557 TaxID=1357279 RepID=W0MRU2_PSESX|nr:ABC transporter substrate-binding protein [Pseudomonas syringae]AHG41162.1 ABC transporter [Pseudomonas syringae CC1557]